VIRKLTHRRPAALAAVVAAGLVLTGCGSSLGIHPGSAEIVGDQRVSLAKIDDTSALYCKALVASQQSQSSQSQSGPIAMGYLRSYVAAGLAKRALGDQLASAYSVEPASGYQQQVSQLKSALASAPADQRDAVIEVYASDAYLQNVQVAIGQKASGQSGSSTAELKAAQQAGQVATQDWLAHHKSYLDPVLGLSVNGGSFTNKQDQTSYPVSALASQGAQSTGGQAPPSTYTSQLPSAQVCG
jgi:hypothetical protein